MTKLFLISGHAVLGEILRRNHLREELDRVARQLGLLTRTHKAQLGDSEFVESNLPLRQSPIANRKSAIPL